MKFTDIIRQDSRTRTYLGSPSLLRINDGTLLATHDYFGLRAPAAPCGAYNLSSIYRSEDHGGTWQWLNHLEGIFWGSLFEHHGHIYLLGTNRRFGNITIRRSSDGGFTWTVPNDTKTGILFPGGQGTQAPNFHCSAVPVLHAAGRIWKAYEDMTPHVWGKGFQALVASAPDDADLLNAASWTLSNSLPFDPIWAHTAFGKFDNPGWLEGNMVASPSGEILNILRFYWEPHLDMSAHIRVSPDGKCIAFDPASGFVPLPGGHSKFCIRQDMQSGLYFAISNNLAKDRPTNRNRLCLNATRDLKTWTELAVLIEDDQGFSPAQSKARTGFQYVDWRIDGDDIIYISRTSYQAEWHDPEDINSQAHNSNRITFHRIPDFRRLIKTAF